MSFQSWAFWDERRLRSETLCSSALKAGLSAPAWAESMASSEGCGISWDEAIVEEDAGGRVASEVGKSL
jgi:hypothetical protein